MIPVGFTLPMNLQRVLTLLAGLLILKVTLSVILGYGDYFPPNFESDFLRGRQAYFSGAYQWAFYLHIVSGPVSLVLGLILMSEPFRMRFPIWHRSIGKSQVVLVLFLLTPSGLWMARYAETGAIAAIGFSLLAIATGMCALYGWQTAVTRRFVEHRRWMWRCFLLLCSAVVLRLIGGLATVSEVGDGWSYSLAAWASWMVPLATFELSRAANRRFNRRVIVDECQLVSSAVTLSLPAMEISARRTIAGIPSTRNCTLPSTNAACTPPG
jgi:hypothetical protein